MEFVLPQQGEIDLISWLYSKRIVGDKDKFLNPKLEEMHDPSLLNDIDKAARAIESHISRGSKIFVYGDYDVDGVTSSAIIWNYIKKELKGNILPYIPSRFTEGYGLHEEGIEKIIDEGAQLIITVDCGIKDIKLIEKYHKKIDFIITDHHEVLKEDDNLITSKHSLANVHPALNNYPFKQICGAMVAFKLIQYYSTRIEKNDKYLDYLDLAAIGTVCDVMPLQDENRIVVKHGLKQLRKTKNIGLKSSLSALKLRDTELDVYHLGFIIGPRLNAAGRIDSAMDSLRLLTTDSPEFALQLFSKLDLLNQTRQSETQRILEIAQKQAENSTSKVIIVYGEEWPEGIVGLIAGRLTEKYNKPSIVGSISKERSVFKASARSIDEINITDELSHFADKFISYGGHSHAAGLSIDIKFLDDFIVEFSNKIDSDFKLVEFTKKVEIDAFIMPQEVTLDTLNQISLLAPFGNGNPTPKLLLGDISIKRIEKFGRNKEYTKFITDYNFEILTFRELDLDKNTSLLSFVGSIGYDSYKKNVNFKVDYIMP